MRSTLSISPRLVLVGALSVSVLSMAHSAPPDSAQFDRTLIGAETKSRVIVLTNLELIEGVATYQGAVLTIQSDGGELVIPANSIMFVCEDREEAYLRLKPRVVPNNAADHVSLARWCATNQLMDEAHEEMKEAVRLNPKNEEYQFLLQRLEDQLNPYLPAMQNENGKQDRFDFSAAAFAKVEPLVGLNRTQAREFTTHVQPILLNSCATAKCHLNSEREQSFSLLKSGNQFQSRRATQANLEQILKWVDKEQPAKSRLFTYHRENEDGKKSDFRRFQGGATEQIVLDWIATLGKPEREEEIPEITGIPRNANVVTSITRDQNRRLRRQRNLEKKRVANIQAAPLPDDFPNSREGTDDFLDELLIDEVTSADTD